MRERRPVFMAHGSPMNAIEENDFTAFLRGYGTSLPEPSGVVVVSAHWQTRGSFVTASPHPGQIYDFSGFPSELYDLEYAPQGSPETAAFLADAGLGIALDPERGLDHGAWTVLKHLWPDARVPVVQLSLDVDKSERAHYELGRSLSRLPDRGLLFLGSGNVVHNLRDLSFEADARPFHWAVEADAWIAARLDAGDDDALVGYRARMPDWRRAIPTDEHFLPLLYILGMRDGSRPARTVFAGMRNGSLSMRCVEA